MNVDELKEIVKQAPLNEDDRHKLDEALDALAYLLPSRVSEKLKELLPEQPDSKLADGKPKAPGHGRNGAEDYAGADRTEVPHEELKAGDACPECPKGKVYPQKPRVIIRLVGQAPIQATVYDLQSLRCNLCGHTFTAAPPAGVGEDKYDETVSAIIAMLKYGSGMPFNRLEAFEKHLGIPLPSSTQWDLMEDAAEILKPAFEQLVREAAEYPLIHTDDTSARILKLVRAPDDKRTGVFTTGMVAVNDDRRIPLFLTGPKHAGENLRDLLLQRICKMAPIQMSDAASRNTPKLSDGASTVLANCLAHGRRHVVDVFDSFPEPCQHILEAIGVAFKNDEFARRQEMSPKERLKHHREHSGPVLAELHKWLKKQMDDDLVEGNSGLGKAISYLLTHWRRLTLFLTTPGAPIDNNICERAIKKAVLHRKNAYFYRTLNGAEVGDIFMTLIHTCELNGVNGFQYLTELLRHPFEVSASPQDWTPWTFAREPAACA